MTTVERKNALAQANELQLRVSQYIRQLGEIGYSWALLGGETTDDGTTLRVTLELATRYAAGGGGVP